MKTPKQTTSQMEGNGETTMFLVLIWSVSGYQVYVSIWNRVTGHVHKSYHDATLDSDNVWW